MELIDGFGRLHDDLRVSVTDRCNLRCSYCMPEEPVWFPRGEILAYEEILRLVRIAARCGVRSVRITGGEPLVRRDLHELVAMLAALPEIADLSMTTNGLLLDRSVERLVRSGLRRINVSLDTLDPQRFERLTRRSVLDRVLEGIGVAVAAGLKPVKVNTVVVRGVNEDEIEEFVARARDERWELRFIEYMPLANGDSWDRGQVVPGDEIRRRIHSHWPLEADPAGDPRAPATRFRFRDGKGTIGLINSVSEPFCETCSRLRLTADGKFRVCLYDPGEVDLKTPLRDGVSDDELERIMRDALSHKGRGGALEILERKAALPLNRTMHQIGG